MIETPPCLSFTLADTVLSYNAPRPHHPSHLHPHPTPSPLPYPTLYTHTPFFRLIINISKNN